MWMDKNEEFSVAQSLVAGTGDLVSTNVLDTNPTSIPATPQNIDVGIGEEVYLNVRIGTAVTNGVGTLQVVLQTDDNVGFATPKEYPLTGLLLAAALTANTFIYQGRLPIGLERFIRVVYRSATAAVTVGTADAFITKDTQANRAYAAGFTIQ
jgi:hypothetical protein